MASAQYGRVAFQVDSVTVEFTGAVAVPKNTQCKVLLQTNQIVFESGGRQIMVIPLTRMKSIQIHQPIFGANYITGEHTNPGSHAAETFTMTFSKGGATEFARVFFSLTEGRLVSDEISAMQHATDSGHPPGPPANDKKNQ